MKIFKANPYATQLPSQRPLQQHLEVADVTAQHGPENQPIITITQNESLNVGIIPEC